MPWPRAAANAATVWDGAYSAAQAERGKVTFSTYCGQCHMDDLSGANGPALSGDRFKSDWDAATLNDLFMKIKRSMPRNAPGTLSDADYVDSVVYILSGNGFPAGNVALPADPTVLGSIQILGKDGRPMPAEDGLLVRTVGCLTADANGKWLLTSSTPPVRTRDTDPSVGPDLDRVAAMALGTGTFRLLAAEPSPASHKGHKMEVKGILASDAIAVASLQMISAACGEQ